MSTDAGKLKVDIVANMRRRCGLPEPDEKAATAKQPFSLAAMMRERHGLTTDRQETTR